MEGVAKQFVTVSFSDTNRNSLLGSIWTAASSRSRFPGAKRGGRRQEKAGGWHGSDPAALTGAGWAGEALCLQLKPGRMQTATATCSRAGTRRVHEPQVKKLSVVALLDKLLMTKHDLSSCC